ncbi:hypothetical protein C8R42DRAFT_650427 [Lentinula raphanica]|nr:hypothetical protein C8R42DRAFT_650427 [Lentinula raphanica]
MALSYLLNSQLTLDEIRDRSVSRKGDARRGTPLPDEEYAFRLFEQENAVELEDLQIGHSLQRAIDSDRVKEIRVKQLAAHDDRMYALAVERGQALPERTAAQKALLKLTPQSGVNVAVVPNQKLSPEKAGGSRPRPPIITGAAQKATEPVTPPSLANSQAAVVPNQRPLANVGGSRLSQRKGKNSTTGVLVDDLRLAHNTPHVDELDQAMILKVSVQDLGELDDHIYALALERGQALPERTDAQRALANRLPGK